MKDEELCKTIGKRARRRRLELGLKQSDVADKLGVTSSTIQRYEAGTIDNSKKMVLGGLSNTLHVSVEWLKGETDELEVEILDGKDLQIRGVMQNILNQLSTGQDCEKTNYLKDTLLLMMQKFEEFMDLY